VLEYQADIVVKLDPNATVIPPTSALQDHLDHLVPLVLTDNQELKVDLEHLERKLNQDHHQRSPILVTATNAQLDRQAHQDLLDHQVEPAKMVKKDHLQKKENLVEQVPMDHLALLDLLAQMESLALVAHQEKTALLAERVQLDHLAMLDLQALQAPQVAKETMESLDLKDHLVDQERREKTDHQAQMDSLELQDHLDHLARMLSTARAHRVHDKQRRWPLQGKLGSLDLDTLFLAAAMLLSQFS